MKKKILPISIVTLLILLGVTTVSYAKIGINQVSRVNPEVADTESSLDSTTIYGDQGTFEGEIGFPRDGEWNKVGLLSGIFNQRNRFYRIEGDWEITEGQQAGATGIINGFFVRNIIIGRITIDESGRKAPIVGFIRINEEEMTFGGRFMSIVGPALYFKGSYQ